MLTHLVTGGSGYLGSFLSKALAERGDRVRIIDLIEPDQNGQETYSLTFSLISEEILPILLATPETSRWIQVGCVAENATVFRIL